MIISLLIIALGCFLGLVIARLIVCILSLILTIISGFLNLLFG